jgi:nitrate reductase (NAD(P)H)
LDSNRTEQDILCRDELLSFAERKGRMKAHFTLSKSPKDGWIFSTGRINDDMMKAHLPPAGQPDTLILICGTSGFPHMGNMCADSPDIHQVQTH